MKKQIAILGSTGSIGTQALQVIEEHPDLYEVYALTANNRVDLLVEQARKFMPEAVVIANEEKYLQLKEALSDLPVKVYAGADALSQIVESQPIDIVLASMVGYAGLRPTINAIKAGKAIALANKETLVVAGELINALANQYHIPVLPVDSEHSAIFQCLEINNRLEKVILTASGGPFRTYTMEQLQTVTKAQALKHPNWEMGAKITIDSASMMNKGFEVIEAKWLFGMRPEQLRGIQRSDAHHATGSLSGVSVFKRGGIRHVIGEVNRADLPYPEHLEHRQTAGVGTLAGGIRRIVGLRRLTVKAHVPVVLESPTDITLWLFDVHRVVDAQAALEPPGFGDVGRIIP